MDVGKRMKVARKIKGISVSKMADMMDVSQPTVTRWENGTIDIQFSTLKRYIENLGYTFTEFFCDNTFELPEETQDILEKIKLLSPQRLKILTDVLNDWTKE